MEQGAQNRRRSFLVDKGFQSKYIALLVVFIISLGIAGLLILVLGNGEMAQTKEGAADLRSAVFAMLAVILLFMGLTIWYGLRFSHRLVGPVYAITRHINWIQDGNYTRDLKLRGKDEFQNIANVFNEMQAVLRQRVRTDVELMQKAESSLAELAQVLSQADYDREAAETLIKRLCGELEAARVKNEGFITP